MNEVLRDAFLDYMNNYCTVRGYADANYLTEDEAKILLALGKRVHERIIRDNFNMAVLYATESE